MIEQRRSTRYPTLAKIRIEEFDNGETLLKDLSITGCRVVHPGYTEIELNR